MFMLLGFLLFVAISTAVFARTGVRNPYSKGIALAAGFSLLAAVCLAQNYTQSLIPEANDGIGISNPIAYWIIGDDRWSTALFRTRFEQSVYLALLLLIAYPIVLILESKRRK